MNENYKPILAFHRFSGAFHLEGKVQKIDESDLIYIKKYAVFRNRFLQ